jgi:beta-lactamase class A
MTLSFRRVCICALALSLAYAGSPARALAAPGPMLELQEQLQALRAPGRFGVAVEDLATGYTSGVNASASLPAASTIKIPVMVEVFRQMSTGSIDLNTPVHLEASDRDWGWGDMADAAPGTVRTVKQLLWLMITESDNTATNMLIRLVGRTHVNQTMARLGLRATRLGDYIRSETDGIRYALRSSPHDMLTLLDDIARDRLIDQWSSHEMLAILTGQHHNGLLPEPLPKDVIIAHKTGSLHDTLNDVGIVYHDDEPYVIAVMTTQLPDLDSGRAFIHKISRLAFDDLNNLATWREEAGVPAFEMGVPAEPVVTETVSPDLQMWKVGPAASALDPGYTPGRPAKGSDSSEY